MRQFGKWPDQTIAMRTAISVQSQCVRVLLGLCKVSGSLGVLMFRAR